MKHDEELWLDDGNIILVAQDVGFRVYKGLLTKQSPVFQDLLGSKENRADEYMDGVPVVRIFDSPYDLRHLLRVLLPTSQETSVSTFHCNPPLVIDLLITTYTV